MKIGKVTWTWRLCGATPIYPKWNKLDPSITILIDWNFLGLSIKSSRENHWPLVNFWTNSGSERNVYYFDKNFLGSPILKKKTWDILKENEEREGR